MSSFAAHAHVRFWHFASLCGDATIQSLSGRSGHSANRADHAGFMSTRPNRPLERVRPERLQIMLDADEFLALDDFRFKKRMPSRASAVCELLKRGLAAEGFVSAKMGAKSSSFGVITKTPTKRISRAPAEEARHADNLFFERRVARLRDASPGMSLELVCIAVRAPSAAATPRGPRSAPSSSRIGTGRNPEPPSPRARRPQRQRRYRQRVRLRPPPR